MITVSIWAQHSLLAGLMKVREVAAKEEREIFSSQSCDDAKQQARVCAWLLGQLWNDLIPGTGLGHFTALGNEFHSPELHFTAQEWIYSPELNFTAQGWILQPTAEFHNHSCMSEPKDAFHSLELHFTGQRWILQSKAAFHSPQLHFTGQNCISQPTAAFHCPRMEFTPLSSISGPRAGQDPLDGLQGRGMDQRQDHGLVKCSTESKPHQVPQLVPLTRDEGKIKSWDGLG